MTARQDIAFIATLKMSGVIREGRAGAHRTELWAIVGQVAWAVLQGGPAWVNNPAARELAIQADVLDLVGPWLTRNGGPAEHELEGWLRAWQVTQALKGKS